jgi:Holliday junction resolvase RusA-like endonuclease
VKPVQDALKNAGFMEDDARVTHAQVSKRYTAPGESPGVHIDIFPLPTKPNN